ncbi:FkbM family methyltransferase [Aliisedimentitalea scapharcae]|uniref:FkbM family methyltransferase n=1 Tax=Aliisedimentitalea scapharcae TaxID=1524259 RepID=A0ABZ2XVM6_9RHOB
MTAAPSPHAPLASVPFKLRLKHQLAVSPLAGPIEILRRTWSELTGIRHPELGLLRQEDRFIDLMLSRMIKPDWTCLDVGGHLGSVSYKLRRHAPDGRLIIIEASPGKAAMLRNSFPDCDVHAVAVSDTDGQVSFFENLSQPGFSSLADRSGRGDTQEITVPARRLDDLIGDDITLDFIKIDVEGFEYPALRGAAALLRRCRPVVLFEAGAVQDETLDTSLTDNLFRMFTDDLNYDVFAAFDLYFDRPALTAAQFGSYRQYPFLAFNYFAVPRDTTGDGT